MDQKVNLLQRKIELVSGICKPAFSLIEILIALVIIALLSSVILPNLWRRLPGYEKEQFIAQINALSLTAWQKAIATGRVHQVLFNLKKRYLEVRGQKDSKDLQGNFEFESIQGALETRASIPSSLQIKEFVVNGTDLMTLFTERAVDEAWFLIYPDGIAQQVRIVFTESNQKKSKTRQPWSMTINPFTGQFRETEG
jgi:prepilin-type N-terminal cleavage/methylation domain-containing protein